MESNDNKIEFDDVSDELKKLLIERSEFYKSHPETNLPWEQVKIGINELISRAKKSEQDIADKKYISIEELEKESENW